MDLTAARFRDGLRELDLGQGFSFDDDLSFRDDTGSELHGSIIHHGVSGPSPIPAFTG
jgi:hypothetical protein